MGLLTTATRMWLTRSTKPFVFMPEADDALPYRSAQNLGLYVHIPFCRDLCAFCPYCKVRYEAALCDSYVDALIAEIHLVASGERKAATSLYFGGGSPALAVGRIGEIIAALREHFDIAEGIGVELHPSDVTVPTLQALKDAGVTKICIGIQSFADEFLGVLGRKPFDRAAMAGALRAVPFETVSMDFIFALPGQTFELIRRDIDAAFASGANHIAIYPFIDFSFADHGVPAMKPKQKRALLDAIALYCREQGYVRDSIWTFSSQSGRRYSSMTRENFLGFGCSATTLLKDRFKVNTFSVEEYVKKVGGGSLPTSLTLRFSRRQRMVYYLFWSAYTMQVSSRDFERFFSVPLKKAYGFELWLAKAFGCATEEDGVYRLTDKGAFYYHHYEQFYTLSYIDRMWGLLRTEAFPKGMEL